jgi:hypothetical protein
MRRKFIPALVALVLALLLPAVAEAASTLALPKKGKLDQDGHVELTVRYSCPATTSPEDSILWLYSTQDEPNFAAGDTAVLVTCDGKRHKYRANLNPNIGEPTYVAGTVFVEAFLGAGFETIHASDSGEISVR